MCRISEETAASLPAFSAIAWLDVSFWTRTHMPPMTQACTVRLDHEVANFQHLIGHYVLIDEQEYGCWGVEYVCHAPPWLTGEVVTLIVTPQGE